VSKSSNRIVSDMQSSVQLGKNTVLKSTAAVDEILNETRKEASILDGFTVANTSSLSAALCEGSKAVNEHLASHISGIENNLQHQNTIVNTQNQSLDSLHTATTIPCVVYAGDESIIQAPSDVPLDHKSTRPHSTIMQEVRDRLQPMPLETLMTAIAGSIPLPVAANVLQPLMSPASFSASRSTSSDAGCVASGRKERHIDLNKKKLKSLRQPPLAKKDVSNNKTGFLDKSASQSISFDDQQNDASNALYGECDENIPNEGNVNASAPFML